MTIVLITGVSRGLGRAMVGEFASHGHTVCGCARTPTAIDELREQFPAPHRFEVVDVADDTAVKDWSHQVLDEIGTPRWVINNAGLINGNAPLWNISGDEFATVVDVNIKGTFHVLRHFLPAMIRQGDGVIVNMSSTWGRTTSPEVAPYCATKWAIEGLTQALASELPDGLVAVPMNPGVIHTEMLESCFGSGANSYPDPKNWAARAVPFILKLKQRDNGRAVTVP